MSDVVGGLIAIASVLLLCAVPVALAALPRPIEDVLTTGSAGGRRGLAIHPDRGHRLLLVIGWLPIGGVLALGVWYLGSSPYAAAFLLVTGAYMAYLGWARATGRAGDGTLTLTSAGIHQFWAGSEILVPWDDVRGLVTTPKVLIVETRRRVQPRRSLPLLGGRRSRPARPCRVAALPVPAAAALPRDDRAVRNQSGVQGRTQHRRAGGTGAPPPEERPRPGIRRPKCP